MVNERDKTITRNFHRLRGNITMAELATRMRNMGHKWSRTTVYSIEHDERRLQAAEAYDFLKVIGHDPDRDLPLLYRSIPRTPVEEAERTLSSHAEILAAAWNAFLLAKVMHARTIDREKQNAGITEERADESRRFADDVDTAIRNAIRDRRRCDPQTIRKSATPISDADGRTRNWNMGDQENTRHDNVRKGPGSEDGSSLSSARHGKAPDNDR